MDQAAAYTAYNTDAIAHPVLISVPHAGRDYPPELLANLRVHPSELLRLEDRYADRLVQPAISSGFPTIVAHRARAWIDLNRAETDIDTAMLKEPSVRPAAVLSAKARGGLGLIPRRLQMCGELWRRPISRDEIDHRIKDFHRPYHESVAAVLAAMHDRFGVAILLDVHSMPPIAASFAAGNTSCSPPVIVLGDRFGKSAASIHSEQVRAYLLTRGIEAALNSPYPGDYMLQRHGNPQFGINALQLEVDRSLYLDSELREPSADLGAAAKLVQDIATVLADQALRSSFAEAAE